MTAFIVIVFLLVYLGMILGNLPFLKLDRTCIALLGATVLVASLSISVKKAYSWMHVELMIVARAVFLYMK